MTKENISLQTDFFVPLKNLFPQLKSIMITCRLIDPDKLNVPDDSLSVVKDSITVLVKR